MATTVAALGATATGIATTNAPGPSKVGIFTAGSISTMSASGGTLMISKLIASQMRRSENIYDDNTRPPFPGNPPSMNSSLENIIEELKDLLNNPN